ncbi:MAG: ATP-dependent helicase, partial [Candidatus Promineofilum sp.]|nr:ATP-dependent helicase [Promineifilum sp.]
DQVRYVVVDEYQDVNPLQERLVRALHGLGANLCVVGDDDQTIYQWRGSEVDNIITFARRYPDVVQVRLNENFRSSPAVVDAARGVVELNDERLPKRMESVDAQPFAYGDILACHFDDPQSEAEWIVEQIRALHGAAYRDRVGSEPRGLAWSDFAILLRSVRNDAGPIVDALAAAGVPFVVGGMNGLFNTPEIEAMRLVFSYTGDFSSGDQPAVTLDDVGAALRRAELGLSEDDIGRGLAMLAAAKAKLGDRTMRELVLQRVYLEFLEALRLYEERIPTVGGRTGELVFYNLGKFSQVITDYEQINLRSDAASLHQGFASFLHYQAPGYYPEGWEEGGLGAPDAVQIMTVHKAKGMQWPAVFVPCLRANRFPAKGGGGRQWYHVLPEAAVANAARYRGSLADERRLFYVAVTRAERFLFCSYSPVPDKKLYNKVSTFFQELTASSYVLSQPPPVPPVVERLAPRPRAPETALALTFSELKYYFDCAYSFKLRFQYGFDAPIDLGLGYGRSLHNALAEIHHESLRGRVPAADRVPGLVAEHLYLPYASEEVRENARKTAEASLLRYLRQHGDRLDKLEHVEKNVELKLADGIVVTGRIDLIRRTDTGQTSVVDFKSNQRAQAEDISRRQLQVYTVGYEQLTGRRADLIEVHNLDGGGVHREQVDQRLIDETMGQIVDAGHNLRDNHLPRLKMWCETCADCDFAGVCRGRY